MQCRYAILRADQYKKASRFSDSTYQMFQSKLAKSLPDALLSPSLPVYRIVRHVLELPVLLLKSFLHVKVGLSLPANSFFFRTAHLVALDAFVHLLTIY